MPFLNTYNKIQKNHFNIKLFLLYFQSPLFFYFFIIFLSLLSYLLNFLNSSYFYSFHLFNFSVHLLIGGCFETYSKLVKPSLTFFKAITFYKCFFIISWYFSLKTNVLFVFFLGWSIKFLHQIVCLFLWGFNSLCGQNKT